MTIVGDIAQSTGPWARDDWDDVLSHLPSDLPQEIRDLKYGYRVPKQIFELAASLLEVAAPAVTAPTIVRSGPASPILQTVSEAHRSEAAVRAAMTHAGKAVRWGSCVRLRSGGTSRMSCGGRTSSALGRPW